MTISKFINKGIEFKFLKALKFLCALLVAAQLFLISSPAALAQTIGPCVADRADIAIPCTRDLNPCGNPSVCSCPDGYTYNQSVGECLIEDISLADGPGKPVENKCVFPPKSVCTQDINVCGNPSICACPQGKEYNNVIGSCVIQLPY